MDKVNGSFEFLEEFDEEIWDEEQWEKFMQESDRLTEKYLKKMEEALRRSEDDSALDENVDEEPVTEELDEIQKPDQSELEFTNLGSSEMSWENEEKIDDFRQIPAYRIAYDFGIAAHDFIEKFYPERIDVPEIKQLARNCFIIAAKIAGGHGIGYEKNVLEGNIANCKRGLMAAEECLKALGKFRIKTKATPELLRLYGFSIKTRKAVEEWINELRSRIWWR